MLSGIRNNVSVAKAGARKLSILYVAVLVLWVMLQSGIPMAPFMGAELDGDIRLQALANLAFVVPLGWLLYLLMAKGLKLIGEAQEALLLLDRAVESSVNAVVITGQRCPEYPVVFTNPAFERITGYSPDEAEGRNWMTLLGIAEDQPELETLRMAMQKEKSCRIVLRSYRKDKAMCWIEAHLAPVRNDAGTVTHYAAVLDDISEMRRYQEELERQANYDSLTGLANRNLLSDRIAHAIARNPNGNVTVFLIGLDKFRLVNDSLGFASGSGLLRAVAARLQSSFGTADTIARCGGDEFALVLAGEAAGLGIAARIQSVLDVFGAPFEVGRDEIFTTASVGIALFPQDGDDAGTLVKRAEIAMHRAKDHDGSAFQMYTAEMDAKVADRVSLENDLRRALERDELVLHYQPRVDLASGRIHGAEALLRWNHPRRGMVSPASFIPLAEETGQIVPIGAWVLRRACEQNLAWQRAGLGPIAVAVNISARQFRQEELVGQIRTLLREVGLDPHHLELEVTESAIMHDADEVIAILHEFKSMGLQLAIDDFGTGYSSLSYLKRFPVDRLKIDQSFVRDIASDADSATIVQTVIGLGRSLGLRTVAEGVETVEQRDFLQAHGCDEIQGYLYGRPMPASELAATLEAESRKPGIPA